MSKKEKQVFYKSSNTYSTLNQKCAETQNIWFACHGLGYLSRYFIRYFNTLDPDKNYIIAPQAPSKYYQDKDYKYVGASWLTKENTLEETQNILAYLDAVYENEGSPAEDQLILFGFSQGVSVSMRWMASRKINPKILVIYAGRIPVELKAKDFEYLTNTQIKIIYGKKDPYITEERMLEQKQKAEELFGKKNLEIIAFEGAHEVNSQVIQSI